MLIGITTGGKVGLGVTALVFIAFALASSFYLPRRNPDFPGERVRGFVWLTVLLFVALIAAVVFFAKESEEGEHPGGEAAATQSETGSATETSGQAEEEPAGGGGDAAAGEAVFASSGCGGCHTLEAAGATGTVGPNLDESQPELDLVVERVTDGKGVMPSFGGDLSDEEIQNVAAYVSESTAG
ncbi:MAG: c-type cytochrome [Actinobacteria bacterium]|nr:c-type cytochrome [Actinomycetota bacterium]